MVNALSESLEVEVARDESSIASAFRAASPQSGLEQLGEVHNRRGTQVRFHPDPQIFGKGAPSSRRALPHGALEGLSLRRRRDPLACASESLDPDKDETPDKAIFHFPGGLQGLSRRQSRARSSGHRARSSPARVEKTGGHGSLEWAITWFGGDGFVHSYCNTIPTPEGGTHEAGFAPR